MLHTFSELFGGLIGDLDGQINDSALEEVFITCCDISNALRLKQGQVFHLENGTVSQQTQK